ncbi:MAG: tetratricopeptide repeat protein [Chloroflexi bacterium]|nr:tetratricopeptide repeat protein [Chloroflexota bacterium]
MNFLKDNKQLSRIIILAGFLLLLLVGAFGVYYYNDRYVHADDPSPIGQAIGQLEEGLKADPQNTDLRIELAENYLLNGDYENALSEASQVLSAVPDNDRALLVIGVTYASTQKPADAIEPLKRFVALRSAASTAGYNIGLETGLYYLGDSYIQVGKPEEAIPVLKQALEINRTSSDDSYLLGTAYAKTGQHEQAIASFETAVLFVPDFTDAYQGMVDSYNAMDRKDLAAYARGMVAYSVKDYGAAVAELEQVVIVLPDFSHSYLGLGLSYEGLGNLTAARDSVKKALEIDPENFAAQQALIRIEATLGIN